MSCNNLNNLGDVTLDGKVTTLDAYEVLRLVNAYPKSLVTNKDYTDDQKKRANVDGSVDVKGNITISSSDALRISRYIKGMDKTFKACTK